MPLASITRLRLRSVCVFPPFFATTLLTLWQARRTPGNLSARIRRHGGAYWTLTLWRDGAAMRAFMLAGVHRKAMPRIRDWCDEAALAHWDHGAVPPSWTEAVQHLRDHGRTTPLAHPSPAHAAGSTLGSGKQS